MSDMWQVAKDMEMKGKAYYEQLAASTPVEEVRSVLLVLAKEEQRHFDLFDSLEKGLPPEQTAAADVGKIAGEAFARIAGEFKVPEQMPDADAAYTKALSFEQASIEYYTRILAQIDDPLQQSIVETIISEERRHEKLVHGFVEYVRRPKEWLEDARFFHLEEY